MRCRSPPFFDSPSQLFYSEQSTCPSSGEQDFMPEIKIVCILSALPVTAQDPFRRLSCISTLARKEIGIHHYIFFCNFTFFEKTTS
jgi:hypothetical protein